MWQSSWNACRKKKAAASQAHPERTGVGYHHMRAKGIQGASLAMCLTVIRELEEDIY